jgi:photosystem II stability/assembly factor-like uncharacterized protein
VRLALRGLLVLVVAGIATQAGAAAPARMRLVTAPFALVMWNEHDGLLGTGRCDVAGDVHEGACVSGAVERTNDGGRTWRVVLHTKHSVDGMRADGPEGATVTIVHGYTWRTRDGGRTWQRVPPQPVVYWLNSRLGVSFRSYFAGSRGRLALRVTHDGGRTWRRQRDPCEKAVAFSASADLVTPTLWWISCLGQPGMGNEDKAIFRTRDAGKTWQAGAATILISPRRRGRHGGISEYGYPAGLAFAPGGWGLLTETRGTLYVTRDGGVHWRAEPHVARPELDFAGGGAAFPGGVGLVLLTDNFHGRLVETRDYGRTWRVVRRWR